MGIQLVVFDVDGTLLHTGERLADATAERIAALVGAGAQLALASARPTESLRLVRDQIGVPMHLVGFNGAEVLHADDTPVREVGFAIEGRLAAALANFVAAGGNAINVYCSDGRWLGIGEKELLDREEHDTWTKATKRLANIRADQLLGLRVRKIMAEGDDRAIPEVRTAVESVPGLVFTHSGMGLNDIWHVDSGKGNALVALGKALKIPLSDVLAVGDSDTDVPMLMAAGTSIAVLPGASDARAAATHSVRGAGSTELFKLVTRLIGRGTIPTQA